MSVKVKEAEERLFDDEVRVCLPPSDSGNRAAFEDGVKEKLVWLKQRLNEFGSVAQIAYHDHKPVAFIEYVSAKYAPVPFADEGKTALVTCLYKPSYKEKGVGSALLKATLDRLRALGASEVKVLVGRKKEWINGGLFLKHGFRVERTLYKPGRTEPLDMLTYDLTGIRRTLGDASTIRFESALSDSLPVHVVCFSSGQCPFGALVRSRLRAAVARFDSRYVVLEEMDTWANCRLARECGAMYGDIFINGRTPFLGPASQEKTEEEISKEIERIKALG